MKIHPIDTLAVWLPMNADGLLIKRFGKGYAYKKDDILVRSDSVIRYAKNYTKGKTKYSLCLISLETNEKKMEKWLDAQAKKLTQKDIEPKFKLLDVEYK